DYGHGTHVAGTIGAVGNNSLGIAGVAWRVRLMAIKFLSASGSGSASDAVRAVNYAVQMGARLTSNSWGGRGNSLALREAIAAAQAAGQLFVAAAGNEYANLDVYPFYPASYDLDNVVAVGATENDGGRAAFSNYGQTVDVSAPGVDVLSTLPRYETPLSYHNSTGYGRL